MRSIVTLVIGAAVLMFAGSAFGQTRNAPPALPIFVSGRVTDANGAPIANATVVMSPGRSGTVLSSVQTSRVGLFVFSGTAKSRFQLHFAAPGFGTRILAVQAKTASVELPDTTLPVVGLTRSAALRDADPVFQKVTLPDDLLTEIRKDFGFSKKEDDDCLADAGVLFEQVFEVSLLNLAGEQNEQVMAGGLGPCNAGAANRPILIYSRTGTQWRKIFDNSGIDVAIMPSAARGFRDLMLSWHSSSVGSVEFRFRFDGEVYRAEQCTEIAYGDPETGRLYSVPKRAVCTWDWKPGR